VIARLRPVGAACAAGLLLLLLLAPPLRQALEASMTGQMLLQMPLLAAAGVLMARALPARPSTAIDAWNAHGLAGLVLATLASAYWMLPRALDAAVTEPSLAIAKHLSVPLLIGLPLALSWPRMGFVVKGVLLLEGIATLLRLGWLYLVSPERLCNLYLLDDQQRLGRLLLLLGAALFLGVACKIVWGHFDAPSHATPLPRPAQR
jgi:hypothetical protein